MGTDSKKHQKRLAAPIAYPIARKPYKFTFHGDGGARRITEGIPLGLILREQLKIVRNHKELKYILNKRQVLVDGKPRTSPAWMARFATLNVATSLTVPVSDGTVSKPLSNTTVYSFGLVVGRST